MALVKPLFMNTSEGFHEELSLTSGDALNVSQIVIPPSVDGGIGIDLGHNPIINVATPVDPDDGVNKAYVDAVASGRDVDCPFAGRGRFDVAECPAGCRRNDCSR